MCLQVRAWLRQKAHMQATKGRGFELCHKDLLSCDRVSHESSESDDSQLATQPPPYHQQDSWSGSPPPCHNRFPDSEAATACISAAISTATIAGESPFTRGQAVTDIITYTADSVASAPTGEAQTTAAAIVAAITDHAANVAAGPGNRFAAISHLNWGITPRPAFREDLPAALGIMNFLIESAKRLPRDQVAVTIVRAVATVANAIANAPPGARLGIAAAYKTTAKHATEVVLNAVRETTGRETALDRGKAPRKCASTGPCDAAMRAAALHAALETLREYTASVGHVQVTGALKAVAAGPRLCAAGYCQYATCTCKGNPTRCEAVLQAHQLLTAFYAVWSLHETTEPGGKAAKALAAAIACAAAPSAPLLEHMSASEIRGRRDALLRVVREMDEEVARLEAAGSGVGKSTLCFDGIGLIGRL